MNQEKSLNKTRSLPTLMLPALIVVFGLQALRGFIPGLAWYLRDTVGLGTISILPYAFGSFFLGFLAVLFRKLFGSRISLWICAEGLALLRLIEVLIDEPAVDFWLGAASVGLFLIALPLVLSSSSVSASRTPGRFYLGILIGFSLDLALRGPFGMRGLSTVSGWLPTAIILLLAALLTWSLGRESAQGPWQPMEKKGPAAVLPLALGPYFMLQLFYFQNTGWLETLSGLDYPAGFLILSAGFLISVGGFTLGTARPQSLHPSLALGSGLLLTYFVYYADQLAFGALGLILIGQFLLGMGLAAIGLVTKKGSQTSIWRTTLAVNSGMLLFLILSFVYYAAQDLPLPFPKASLPALAAGIYACLTVWASLQAWKMPKNSWHLAGLLVTGVLVLVPVTRWAAWGSGPEAIGPPASPVKVMSYNIHSAINVAGGQDLEAIAAVIEDSGADIIGLQEVSRTRLMDGGADMPIWLSQRLGMEMVFTGTEEPIWGNALLSRYPILESGFQSLPRESSLIGRGFLWARIDVGAEEPLLVVVTHLHHIVDEGQIRLAQVPVILDFLEGEKHFVFLGDLNAEPDSPEIKLIVDAGLVDAWLEAGEGPGFTIDSIDPTARIDYLWHSPDLGVSEIQVIPTTASDHLPVIAVLDQW